MYTTMEEYDKKEKRRKSNAEAVKRYRERNKEKIQEYYIKNREHILNNHRRYYKAHREKFKTNAKERYIKNKEIIYTRTKNNIKEKWYCYLHNKTNFFIKKYNLRPNVCSICRSKEYIYAHHIDNNIWNKIVFCCKSCHQRIHSWAIECPKPIDLLFIKKEHDDKNSKGFTPEN